MSQRKRNLIRNWTRLYLCSITASDRATGYIQRRDSRGHFTDCGNSQQLLIYDLVSKAVKAAAGSSGSHRPSEAVLLSVCAVAVVLATPTASPTVGWFEFR